MYAVAICGTYAGANMFWKKKSMSKYVYVTGYIQQNNKTIKMATIIGMFFLFISDV